MWPRHFMASEFDVIKRYFDRPVQRKDVLKGIGDDGALLAVPANNELVISTDTLVCGTHFLPTIDPADLAYKAVAVNLRSRRHGRRAGVHDACHHPARRKRPVA